MNLGNLIFPIDKSFVLVHNDKCAPPESVQTANLHFLRAAIVTANSNCGSPQIWLVETARFTSVMLSSLRPAQTTVPYSDSMRVSTIQCCSGQFLLLLMSRRLGKITNNGSSNSDTALIP